MCETITKEQLYSLMKSNAEFNGRGGEGGGRSACSSATHTKAEMGAMGASSQPPGSLQEDGVHRQRMRLGGTFEPRGKKAKA